MNTVAMSAGVSWSSSNVDDRMALNIRIVNGATILAAADAAGTFQELEPEWQNTASGTTNVVSFSYVNLTADKAAWDGASVEVQQTYAAVMQNNNGSVTSVGAMTFNIDYDVFVASDDLLAEDVESASEVTTPALAQAHVLTATSVQSTSEVSSPAVGQVHALAATSVESTSEVTNPSIALVTPLTANDVESASEVSTPAVGQTHVVTATSVESTSEVSSPALGQVHNLTATSVQSTSEVSAPAAGQDAGLLAEDIEAATEVSTPNLGQVHALTAVSVQSTSEVSAPAVGEPGAGHTLLAEDIEATSEVSSPALGQIHTLTVASVESTSEVTAPTLAIRTLYATCTLVDRTGTPRIDLENLSWAWFDAVDPASMGAPTDQGGTEVTDGTGEIRVDLPSTTLVTGQSGTLVLRSDNGVLLGAYNLEVV